MITFCGIPYMTYGEARAISTAIRRFTSVWIINDSEATQKLAETMQQERRLLQQGPQVHLQEWMQQRPLATMSLNQIN